MPRFVFEGTVFSGEGKGKMYVELPWFRRQVEEKLGFSPYPGTLNLRLTGKEVDKRRLLETAGGIFVEPQTGYYSGVLFKATLKGLECAIAFPVMPNYPNDVLEIIAPVYLRGRFSLVDGSKVSIEVTA